MCLEKVIWTDHFVPKNYQGSWSAIPLRCQADAEHPIMMIVSNPVCEDWVDTPFLALCPYFQQVLAVFECPLEAVRLMRLTAGSIIKPHTDHDLCLEDGHARLHVPVQTNPHVTFTINNSPMTMKAGECWYLRFADEHSVKNLGETDRIHMVIDVRVNDWLLDLFS